MNGRRVIAFAAAGVAALAMSAMTSSLAAPQTKADLWKAVRRQTEALGDGRRPRARLRAERFDGLRRQRNGRVDEPPGASQHQDFPRPLGAGRGARRQRRHHRLDRQRIGRLRLPAAAACVERRGE